MGAETPPTPSTREGIYVGYLPVPRATRRTLRLVVPLLIWAMLLPAFLWARAQQPTEPALWDTSAAQSWTGTLALEPYPMLVTAEGTHLIVESGKHGAQPRFQSLSTGATVTLRGYPLTLGDRRMIELLTTDEAVGPTPAPTQSPDPSAIAPLLPTERRAVILRGEIVDAKCHLGAMKPGRGTTHKACATLCVRGGIPAVLVGFDALGRERSWIITNDLGGPIDAQWLGLIGEPVELRGSEFQAAGLPAVAVELVRPLGR